MLLRGGLEMKKIGLIVFVLLIALVTSLTTMAADELDTLVVHYFRYDGIYNKDGENYFLHLWQKEPTDKGGIDHQFGIVPDQYGVSLTVDMTDPTNNVVDSTRLGLIVKHKSGWPANQYREPGDDRFIYVSDIEVVGGVGHVYIVQSDLNIGTSSEDLANNIPDYRPKIITAIFNDSQDIVITLSHVGSSYTLYADNVNVKSGVVTSQSMTISVQNIDISKTYEIEVEFDDTTSRKFVSMNGLYNTPEFEEAFTFTGELGSIYTKAETTFRLWAPISQAVTLNLYEQGHPQYDRLGNPSTETTPYATYNLEKIEKGAWEVVVDGDLDGKYYTFTVENNEIENEVTDPYSYSTGANGLRSMVVNFEKTNPAYWEFDERPRTIKNFTDYIVWELHVRDLTTHSSWNGNEAYRGKFLGLTQGGTTYTENGVTVSTGLDHIDELGVNAVQLLPIFDFGYIDEVEVFKNPLYPNTFNWGYMPYHFNTLQGSYSSNPFDGYVRMYEFKQAVQALHLRDIRVIMDVVYNHTGESGNSNFNKIVPGYYHRLNQDGGFSNGSGTGNEMASERSMVRKFMVDSTEYLATEYHLSGFRFDLMALHDIETMNAIREKMDEIDPTIVLYGEPWAGGDTTLKGTDAAGMTNTNNWNNKQVLLLDNVGAFNDTTRDAIKGKPDDTSKGFVQGDTNYDRVQAVQYGIAGGVSGFSNVSTWHGDPNKHIIYVSAHDNLTLHDKLHRSGVTNVDKKKLMQIQANAIVLTSQGIPFLHAGVEFMRSKPDTSGGFVHNSYESPDSVNQLNWSRKLRFNDVFEYYKALIAIRKTYPQFRMSSASEIQDRLSFLTTHDHYDDFKSIAFKIEGIDNQSDIVVIHSGNITGLTTLTLSDGKTYQLLTSYLSTDLDGLGEVTGSLFAVNNTTSIYVEIKDDMDDISIIENTVTIAKDANFDELSNVTVGTGVTAYATDIDTSVPGTYIVAVSAYDYLGREKQLYYTLVVTGNNPNISFGGLS